MPRNRAPNSPAVVYRTARAGLRLTRGQRRRLVGLLVSAGDVWACVLEVNAWRRARGDVPLVSYRALCQELATAGPGCFGELDTAGARSVLCRYSDAWFAAAARRKNGDGSARFPRRRRKVMPVRWYHGRFELDGRRLRIPVARGCPPLRVRLDRDLPYPAAQVRSVTLLYDAGRLWADVTAEVPVTVYPAGSGADPGRVAGVDLGILHPYAVAGPDGQALLVSGRAIRAEHHLHLKDTKARHQATARRAPKPGQRGSRRWRHYRRRQRIVEARHARRVRQAQHEAARTVIGWAIAHRIGTLAVGDPRGVLGIDAGRRHNRRTRDWRVGRLISVLRDKAGQAGITLVLADERGTSSTCPACRARVPKPAGRVFSCPGCGLGGHRDLVAAANIAARAGGGLTPAVTAAGVTHRRAGNHLPGVSPARRDPRRRPHHGAGGGSPGRHLPAPPDTAGRGVARPPRGPRKTTGEFTKRCTILRRLRPGPGPAVQNAGLDARPAVYPVEQTMTQDGTRSS
jgi:transposase